jgi:hypothetical protein
LKTERHREYANRALSYRYSVFRSGGGRDAERITIKKVVSLEDVRANEAEFVAALRLFRQTASALAIRLARRLRVPTDRLLDLGWRSARAMRKFFGIRRLSSNPAKRLQDSENQPNEEARYVITWDEHFLLWSETRQHRGDAAHRQLQAARKRTAQNGPEDWQWLHDALDDPQKKWFVAEVFRFQSVPKRLRSAMLRAGIYERNPSFNRLFVEPCVRSYGSRWVKEQLLLYRVRSANSVLGSRGPMASERRATLWPTANHAIHAKNNNGNVGSNSG